MITEELRRLKFDKDNSPYVDIYELLYYLYQCTGFGVNDFPSKWQVKLYDLYHLLCYFQYVSVIVPFSIYIMREAVRDTKELILSLGLMIVGCGILFKIILMDFNKKYVREVHGNLRKDLMRPNLRKKEWYPEIRDKFDRDFKKIVLWFLCLVIITLTVYVLPAAYSSEKELPIPNAGTSEMSDTAYTWLLVWQCSFLIAIATHFISYDMTACGLVLRLASHLQMIISSMENMTRRFYRLEHSERLSRYEDCAYDSVEVEDNFRFTSGTTAAEEHLGPDEKWDGGRNPGTRLREIIRENFVHYQEIAKQMKKVDRTYTYAVSLQLLGGTFVGAIFAAASLIGEINDVKMFRQFWFGVAVIYDLYMYCYSGTKLEILREKVCFSLYDCPWYEMNLPTRKLILQSITMTQKNLKFRAGGLIQVNLVAYLQVLKLSYNIITVLINVM